MNVFDYTRPKSDTRYRMGENETRLVVNDSNVEIVVLVRD